MKVSAIDTYQSQFLGGGDLTQPTPATIERVALEEFFQGGRKERFLVLSFVGKRKRLVLNKTRAGQMVAMGGDETDGWVGLVVRLVPTEQSGKQTIHITEAK